MDLRFRIEWSIAFHALFLGNWSQLTILVSQRHQRVFGDIDQDNDKALTLEEFVTYYTRRGPGHGPRGPRLMTPFIKDSHVEVSPFIVCANSCIIVNVVPSVTASCAQLSHKRKLKGIHGLYTDYKWKLKGIHGLYTDLF